MSIDSSLFKAYDIRGVYPRELNENNIQTIVAAIYDFFRQDLKKSKLSVVLGRDMRLSSPSLFAKAKEILARQGASIVDVGLVSTPTFYFAVLDGQYDAGIQVSASHNPKEYNGLKFVKRVGKTLIKIGQNTGMDQVRELSLAGNTDVGNHQGMIVEFSDAVDKEVEAALKSVNPQQIKKFKVVADPGNAMAILYLDKLFKKLPCELIKMNFQLDGNFPAHQPDPLQFSTLKDLQTKVIADKADLGIAPDGDGDRVFFIDEKGRVVSATMITSLIAKAILTKHPGEKILADIRDIMNVKATCKKYGGKFLLSRVGHALITAQLNSEEAAFAGESSGHFYFRETGGAESSVRVILYVLEAMGQSDKPISELLEEFHSAFESGEYNFVLPAGLEAKKFLSQIESEYKQGQISHLDGLAVNFPDWRFNMRTSNTEPLLRLNLEANSEPLMKQRLDELLESLNRAGLKRK